MPNCRIYPHADEPTDKLVAELTTEIGSVYHLLTS